MKDVEIADRKSQIRAKLFLLLAACLLLQTWLGADRPLSGERLVFWLVTIGLVALNLTPLPPLIGRFRRAGWTRLMDDETTHAHRRTCLALGFWAAMAAAGALMTEQAARPLASGEALRIVTATGFAAALIAFAVLELRAARG